MIITVASYKGGVAKTVTAVHLAAYLNTLGPTLLLDGDQKTRDATAWSGRGAGFPFKVAPAEQGLKLAREYAHVVIDTGAGLSASELKSAAGGCDLLVIPTVPAAQESNGLGLTVMALEQIEAANYRVLLSCVSPDAAAEATELRRLLKKTHTPVFRAEIPRLKAYRKAALVGCIVCCADDRQAKRAWEAYADAGRELMAT